MGVNTSGEKLTVGVVTVLLFAQLRLESSMSINVLNKTKAILCTDKPDVFEEGVVTVLSIGKTLSFAGIS